MLYIAMQRYSYSATLHYFIANWKKNACIVYFPPHIGPYSAQYWFAQFVSRSSEEER